MAATGVVERLKDLLGPDHVLDSPASLISYGIDATGGYRGHPLAAVFPGSSQETAQVLRLAVEFGIQLVGRGSGTSLSAGAVPADGSIVISLSRLTSGPHLDEHQMTVRAGAGVTTRAIQDAALAAGLFYPPDPSSQDVTTIGGNAATNAGGPHALKYGVTRHYVTAVEVAFCSGEIATFERGTAGEPMVDLMIGSEGTIGLITEVRARLMGAPKGAATVTATFPHAEDAARATVDLLQTGLVPAKLEFMDDVSIRAVQAANDRRLPGDAGAILLVEMHGDPGTVGGDSQSALESLRASGAIRARLAESKEEQALAWEARGAITSSLARLKPGKIGEDICVPRANVPAAVERIKKLSADSGMIIALFGHIGDGTLHPNIVYEPGDEAEMVRVKESLRDLARIGVDLGGVLSGEHGLGLVKRDFVPYVWDWDAIRTLRELKRQFDPSGVLNPNIMWPDQPSDEMMADGGATGR